jgi:hypothetical protein
MAWKRIGNCPGEWFAATRDRLLTIAPPGILLSRPATELPLEAEAWEVVEKPCDARYLAVVGETLYRRDTQDRVWTRPVAGGPRAWRLVGRVDPEPQEREFNAGLQGPQGLPVFPRAEYAGHPEHLYLAQGNGSLWARTEGTGANPWRLVGRVPGPTIAANPTTLFAWVPPLGIQARPADLAIHDWQPIDPLPLAPPYAGFVHLAATPHWLFAWAWEEGRPVRGLYVRPATTTAHPFRRIGTCPGEWIVASADCLFAPTDDGTLAARPATPDYLEAKDWVPVEKCDIRFLTGGPGGMILRWDRQGRVWSRGTTPGPEPWRQVGLAQKEGIP